jgi:rare lipoprotein A
LALLAAAIIPGLALGGCAETTLIVHSAKQLQRNEPPRAQPVYKVGEPYQINGIWYYPAEEYRYSETGIASYYGGEQKGVDFHARMTANGEIYDMNGLTAAHQTLPMPSLVRVTNLENGRSIVLRVNDRGPFARGRVVDVSRRAAQLLGFEAQGTARVRVEVLAEESRALKLALLEGKPGTQEFTTVAAVPRGAVASDSLPPPPGARVAGPVASAPLPPPSETLPPPEPSAASRKSAGRNGSAAAQVATRPAAPIITSPAPAGPPVPAGPAAAASRQIAPAQTASREVAALPVPSHAQAAPMVTQEAVRPSGLFVQAGAFANYDTAYRLSARLSRYGSAKVSAIGSGSQQLYRVRVGPVQSVREADTLLDQVATVAPDARVVVVE